MASNTPTQLPAYIALRYEENGVFDKFSSEAERAATETKKRFNQAFAETERVVQGSVGRISSQFGKLDLGVSQFRQQQAEIKLYRDALDETARAAQRLAKDTGDTSVRTREYVRALTEQRAEADRALNVANAQVATYSRLQSAIDATTSANGRLAQSQREVYAEQARAAREEVAARERQNLYAVGFSYDRPAKNASASADVFQSQGYKPTVDLRDAVQKIRDGDAAMDRAALSGTTLEQVLGRVAGKSREVSAAVTAQARAEDAATAETVRLAQAIDRLHAEVDPLIAVQQRYAAQVMLLDEAERKEIITAEQRATIQGKLKNALDQGTTATRNVINSQGALRQATLQSGQQLQDIVISLYSGQKAAVVFAQQLPQLAFGLSGLEGSANKAHDRVGRFATFLSGPWGIGVGLAVGFTASFIASLFDAGDQADKTGSAVDRLKDRLDLSKNSYKSLTDVVNDYNQAQSKSEALTYQAILSAEKLARANLQVAETSLARMRTSQQFMEENGGLIAAAGGDDPSVGLTGQALALRSAQQRVDQLRKDLDAASTAAAVEDSRRATDQRYSIEVDYNAKIADLIDRGKKGLIDKASLTAKITTLTKAQTAALEAYDDANRKASSTANRQFGREIDMSAARSIAASAGFKVNSGTRPTWIKDEVPGGGSSQERLYNTVRTPQNPVARPGTSAHETGKAIDIAFGPGVSVASIRKAYAEEGVKLTKVLTESGHFHIEWSTKGADKAENEAEALAREAKAAAREAEQLAEYARDAAARVGGMRDAFTDTPPLIARMNSGLSQLADMSDDIDRRLKEGLDPKVAEALKAEIAMLKPVIEDSLNEPMRDYLRDQNERLAVQRLAAAGFDDEAQALQVIQRMERDRGEMSAQQKADVLDRVRYETDITRELARQRVLFDAQLDVIDTARRSLADTLSGRGNNPFKEIGQSLKDLQGKRIFDSLFGNVFDDLEKELRGQSPLAKESQGFADDLNLSREALTSWTAAMKGASTVVANDNGGFGTLARATVGGPSVAFIDAFRDLGAGEAAATAVGRVEQERKVTATIARSSVIDLANRIAGGVVAPFQASLNGALGTRFGQLIGGTVQGAIAGTLTGGTPGSILGGLRGATFELGPDIFGKGVTDELLGKLDGAMGGAAMGSQIAGISKALGIKSSTTGSQVGGALGALTGIPGGDIIGSIAGGLLGNLFKSNKTARALLTSGTAYSVGGADNKKYGEASSLGDSVLGGLNKIADAFDAEIGPFLVSIGTRGDEIRVNTAGSSLKTKKGATGFGEDTEAAVRYAIMDAIEDGALKGLRASTLRIIKGGKDLDAALQDAIDFENAFKELKGIKDPLGAAIDGLNSQFDHLIDLAKQGGASTEEWAQLEELYGLKRNQIIEDQAEQLVGGLKSLLSSLTIDNNAFSLRERNAAALAKYDPLKARVAAGDTSAYDEFADAAQQLLEIERDRYGSQQGYFDRLAEVTALTRDRISAETNVVAIAQDRDNPFDNTGKVKDSVDTQTTVLGAKLDAVNTNLGALIQLYGAAGAATLGYAGLRYGGTY